MSVTTSPLTEDESPWTEDAVFETVWFRMISSDDDWAADEASARWDLSRAEAATRIENEDYSPPE